MYRVSSFILLIFFASCVANMGTKNNNVELLTEEEVMAVISKFDEGWKNKNEALVDSVLSEHYVYFTQSGNTFNRAKLVATAGSDVYTLQNMERENFVVQIEGNTAVVSTIWKGEGYYHGEQFNDRQRCSVTIVKHNGIVKILAEHCTPIKK
jgi:hypothetical protein